MHYVLSGLPRNRRATSLHCLHVAASLRAARPRRCSDRRVGGRAGNGRRRVSGADSRAGLRRADALRRGHQHRLGHRHVERGGQHQRRARHGQHAAGHDAGGRHGARRDRRRIDRPPGFRPGRSRRVCRRRCCRPPGSCGAGGRRSAPTAAAGDRAARATAASDDSAGSCGAISTRRWAARSRYRVERLWAGLWHLVRRRQPVGPAGHRRRRVQSAGFALLCRVPIKAAAATSNFMIGVTAAASAFLYSAAAKCGPLHDGGGRCSACWAVRPLAHT